MNVLGIIGTVIGGIVLFILLILLLPLNVTVKTDGEFAFKLKLRVLFFSYSPKKPVTDKQIEKSKAVKDFLTSKKDDKEIKSKKTSITEKASAVFKNIKLITDRLKWLVKHINVKRLRIKAVCASGDAAETAMEYGTACAVIYPMVGYIQSNLKVRQKGIYLDVRCDFNEQKPEFEVETTLSVQIFQLVRALIYIVYQNVK